MTNYQRLVALHARQREIKATKKTVHAEEWRANRAEIERLNDAMMESRATARSYRVSARSKMGE